MYELKLIELLIKFMNLIIINLNLNYFQSFRFGIVCVNLKILFYESLKNDVKFI